MQMLEILTSMLDESSLFFADEIPDLLDENSIAWEREHEFFVGEHYCLIIKIENEYFQFNEDEKNALHPTGHSGDSNGTNHNGVS